MGLSRFSGMWSYANATAVDAPRSDEDAAYLTFESASELGMEADASTGEITIEIPGFYLGVFSASFLGTTGVTYFFEFHVNGIVGAGFRCTADGLTGGSVNVAMFGATKFEVGDVVKVRIYCDEDGETATIVDSQFGLISM